jgi:sporulation protein YlmC with PRC-barrel domain
MFDRYHILEGEVMAGTHMLSSGQLLLRIALAAAVLGGWAALVAQGADAPAKNGLPGQTEKSAEMGPVHSARSYLGNHLKNARGEDVGTIVDVSLNIGKGTVAGVILTQSKGEAKSRESMAMPLTALHRTENGDLAVGPSTQRTSSIVSPGNTDDKTDVVALSKLGEVTVANARGEKLGRIVDFGLASQSGLIAYAALVPGDGKSSDGAIYSVPLAAFVAPKGAQQWILELPQGILENTPHFDLGHWPHSVEFAWMEYVRERYGRSPFGGVQRELVQK